MYGYCPSEKLKRAIALEYALSLKSRVCLIKDMPQKRGVSYGRSYITPANTRIAVVPVGYSHGYQYALSKKTTVLIKGKRYPIAGNVCMDYIMIDIGSDDTIDIGDEVVLLGRSGTEEITAYELAQKGGTISYEVITNLGAHIPRMYINTEDE
jgi:alanine racemase